MIRQKQPPVCVQQGKDCQHSQKKLVDKILAGEFVDFADLPPAKGRVKANTHAMEGQIVVIQAADLLENRKLIPDLATWVQCFMIYSAVLISKEPDRAKNLLAYMSLIAKCSLKYKWPSWVVYDLNFRQEAVETGQRDWSKVEPSIYTQYFTGAAINQESWCRRCHSIDHATDTCPLKQGNMLRKRENAHLSVGPPMKRRPPPQSNPQIYAKSTTYTMGTAGMAAPACFSTSVTAAGSMATQHSSAQEPKKQAGDNMKIAEPQVVLDFIGEELQAGRLVELTEAEAAALNVHCSPIGIIPKKNKPRRWRLIMNLLAPEGASVNDGIAKELCSLSYISVDMVADRVLTLGQGALIAKMDVKQAYRMVPVHPHDRPLLGMRWEGKVFVDKTLPFGLRSAPIIFSALADALAWSMRQKGVTFVEHYIDDFVTVGRQGSLECQNNLETMLRLCDATGTPIDPEKTVVPCTTLTFLGIEIDTVRMQLRLPEDKLARLVELLQNWRVRRCCKKRDLQSLIGVLAHTCKVVRPG